MFLNADLEYVLTLYVFCDIIMPWMEGTKMPIKPRDMEKIILADGWRFKSQVGSHRQYTHPSKPGKVTIPWHGKDLPLVTEKSIRKQAGLK